MRVNKLSTGNRVHALLRGFHSDSEFQSDFFEHPLSFYHQR